MSSQSIQSMRQIKILNQQREQGNKGLVPRAKLLLSLGGTFSLAFGPLIIVTVSLFAGLYLYFGQSFVHDGSKKPVAPPPYIDPYELLEDDMISRPSLDVFWISTTQG